MTTTPTATPTRPDLSTLYATTGLLLSPQTPPPISVPWGGIPHCHLTPFPTGMAAITIKNQLHPVLDPSRVRNPDLRALLLTQEERNIEHAVRYIADVAYLGLVGLLQPKRPWQSGAMLPLCAAFEVLSAEIPAIAQGVILSLPTALPFTRHRKPSDTQYLPFTGQTGGGMYPQFPTAEELKVQLNLHGIRRNFNVTLRALAARAKVNRTVFTYTPPEIQPARSRLSGILELKP